jgi:serine/threonine protein kinase
VLYEMLTGKKAFEGKSQASVIAAILNRNHQPQRNVLTPPELDRLVGKCLQRDPDERWQSAKDLGDELRWLARSSHGTVVPVSQDHRPARAGAAASSFA